MQFVEAKRADLSNRALHELIAYSLFEPDESKIERFLGRVDFARTRLFLAVEDTAIVGQITVTSPEGGSQDWYTTIDSISVLEARRRRGVGRFLVQELCKHHPDAVLSAETDGSSVGFYHNLGFRIRTLGEKYPGTIRYRCTYAPNEWDPLPYRDAAARFSAAGAGFWVAGGWALDLFLGRQSRPHEDTDILIGRPDQHLLFDVFPGWEIYRTHAPGLSLWPGRPYLDATPNVWLRKDTDSPWSIEVMFLEVQGNEWVYRRNRAVRGTLEEIGLRTAEGIPYLRPEVQLLFKGGSSGRREKDTQDLLSVLPSLPDEARAWLARSLRIQFPGGHEWLEYLQ